MGSIGSAEIAARYGVSRPQSHHQGRVVFRIPCPVHGGEDKNLAIWDGDGGSLGAVCHSRGCTHKNIMDALGIAYTYEGREHRDAARRTVYRRRGVNADGSKDLSGNPGSPRGLYVKLDAGDAPTKSVVVVEGERAFDWLAGFEFDHYTAAHWVGGTGSVASADYSPLQGRDVILWPDKDEPGQDAMAKAAVCARAAGATSLRMVNTSSMVNEGDDAADVDGQTIRELLEAAEMYEPPTSVSDQSLRMAEGGQFARDSIGLRAVLTVLLLETRYTSRYGRVEVRRTDGDSLASVAFLQAAGLDADPAGWAPLNDRADAYFRDLFERQFRAIGGGPYKMAEELYHSKFLAMTAGETVDPVRSYLDSLPAWDGVERVPTMFVDALGAEDTELTRAIASAFMVGGVVRTYQPGFKHDWAPVLVGKQGAGKSTFCEELVPPGYRGWHVSLNDLEADDSKIVERVKNAWVVEFAELRGLASFDKVKSFMSTPSDSLRLAWARKSEDHPRAWVGIGTANDLGTGVLPDDSSGNRRYATVEVQTPGSTQQEQSGHVRRYLACNREQLWAEAIYSYLHGGINYLAGKFELARDTMNSIYTRANQPMEEIAARLTTAHANGEPTTLAALMYEGGLAHDTADAESKMQSAGRILAGELIKSSWVKSRKMVNRHRQTAWTPPAFTVMATCSVAACAREGTFTPDDLGRCPTCIMENAAPAGASVNCPHGPECPACQLDRELAQSRSDNQLRMFRDLADHVAHGPDAAADVTGIIPGYATIERPDGTTFQIPVLVQTVEEEA